MSIKQKISGSVDVEAFLTQAEAIAGENPSYRIGGTGTDGSCDCIGLVVGAIRRAGGRWTGRKGTNYAARNEMRDLRPIGSGLDLKRGEVVYKAHEPNAAGYDAETIRKSYASSPDQRDYYHIGVVLSPDPLRILHMTRPLPRLDRKLGQWRFHGRLKRVNFRDVTEAAAALPVPEAPAQSQAESPYESPVRLAVISGGNEACPVNQRAGATRRAKIIARIPQQAEAEILSAGETWCRVRYRGRAGYVMTRFIHDKAA